MKKSYFLAILFSIFSSIISCKKNEPPVSSTDTTEEEAKKEYSNEIKQHSDKMKENISDTDKLENYSKKIIKSSETLVSKTTGENQMLARVQLKCFEQKEAVISKMREKTPLMLQAIDYSSIKTEEDAKKSITHVEEYLTASINVKDFFATGFTDFIIETLNSEDLDQEVKNNFLIGYKDSSKELTANIIKIREQDEILCKNVIIHLKILSNNLGHWTIDTNTNLPEFDESVTKTIVNEFDEATRKIQKAFSLQAEIQESMVKP